MVSPPKDVKLRAKLSAYYVLLQRYEESLLLLQQIMDIDRDYDEEYARKAMLRIINQLEDGHELINRFRTSLRRYAH